MTDFDYFDTWYANDFIRNHPNQMPKILRPLAVELLRWWTTRVIKSTTTFQRQMAEMATMERCCFCKIE